MVGGMSGFQGYDQWKTASPYDDEQPCKVCELDAAECECPECQQCGEHGDPRCYFEDGIFGGCNRWRWFENERERIINRLGWSN